MSELVLVRHGQASMHEDDYDRLSPLGEEQGRHLGRHWAQLGTVFDRVYVGPRRRHRQTLDAVAEAYGQSGLPWPEPELVEELDEHHGQAVIAHYLERLTGTEPPGGATAPATEAERLRRYLEAFRKGTRQWVRGELATPPGLEPWTTFRARLEAGLARLTDGGPGGRRAVAFTSGGAVAAAMGWTLGLGDETVLELSWRVRNGALTGLLFSRGKRALDVFNATPHLGELRLLSFV